MQPGNEPTVQAFEFEYRRDPGGHPGPAQPRLGPYVYGEDFFEGFGSPTATPKAIVVAIDVRSTPERTTPRRAAASPPTSTAAGFEEGDIALIQRGTCDFVVKVANAQEAGASGVIIFNEGNAADRMGLIFPDVTGGRPITIRWSARPSRGPGACRAERGGRRPHVRIALDIFRETRRHWNVIAELPGQRDDRDVVVGAHLDSVLEGPGINDNGSGSAMILEMARRDGRRWASSRSTPCASRSGVPRSPACSERSTTLASLASAELKDIAVNLNFDMVGSTNYVRFVYDGDAGPVGSGVVEDVFLDWFASQGLATEPTAFDGRSDYGPFIAPGRAGRWPVHRC